MTSSWTTARVWRLIVGGQRRDFNVMARAIQNSIAVNQNGSGTLTLSGANAYSATPIIKTGKLGTTTASIGAGNYSVSNNAALGITTAITAGHFRSTISHWANRPHSNSIPEVSASKCRNCKCRGSPCLNGPVTVSLPAWDSPPVGVHRFDLCPGAGLARPLLS